MRSVDSESWFLERDIAVGFLKSTFLVLLCYIREKADLSPPDGGLQYSPWMISVMLGRFKLVIDDV